MISPFASDKGILILTAAIVSTVAEMPPDTGAPGGILYTALMGRLDLGQFNCLMSGLVTVGFVTKRGQCYFATPKGVEFAKRLANAYPQG